MCSLKGGLHRISSSFQKLSNRNWGGGRGSGGCVVAVVMVVVMETAGVLTVVTDIHFENPFFYETENVKCGMATKRVACFWSISLFVFNDSKSL